ncbi:MAG: hypothetical protein COU65_02540 [Candidatus Pacebacteria bacterium CG10_big_fil_rev_8_21_14_0_10_42_12]|nr:hypothetical protein [Candidatus Paceibacterota bacterium]PIR62618.1 MAG: hypothetical protein COU65_02540 [Candidatus Pacebacteria bacterium CG10_big_fil_rev_8_21_14_0_10_42_12]
MEIQLSQIVFQLINFSIVFGALSYLLYKPILKIFAERSKRIEEGQKAAEAALLEREKVDQLKQKSQNAIEKERAKILAEATKMATIQKKEIIAEARLGAEAEIAQIKQQWKDEQARQIAEMQQSIVDLVIETTAKVSGEQLSEKKHHQLIADEIKSLSKVL